MSAHAASSTTTSSAFVVVILAEGLAPVPALVPNQYREAVSRRSPREKPTMEPAQLSPKGPWKVGKSLSRAVG